MKKLINIVLCSAVFALGIFVGLKVMVPASAAENNKTEIKPVFEVNENGQTYGDTMYCTKMEEFPDLIGAVSKDGTEGYVYFEDLYGNIPDSPEAAAKYMEDIIKQNEDGVYTKTVLVYESDGKTVVGEYEVSIDAGMFATASEYSASKKNIWD